MEKNTDSRKLLWVDLETTGDDPNKDVILEVGWMISDYYDMENVLDEGDGQVIYQSFPYRHLVTVPAVWEMHTKSGLFDDLENPDKFKMPLAKVEHQIVSTMSVIDRDAKWILAGSGVSQLDAHFIRRHMPLLFERLMYFYVDIGQVRRFLRDLVGFEMSPEGKEHYAAVRNIGHRAYDDIKAHHMEAVIIQHELKSRL